jgi:hypothetical protein
MIEVWNDIKLNTLLQTGEIRAETVKTEKRDKLLYYPE